MKSTLDPNPLEFYESVIELLNRSDDPEAGEMKEVIRGWIRDETPLPISFKRPKSEVGRSGCVIERPFP